MIIKEKNYDPMPKVRAEFLSHLSTKLITGPSMHLEKKVVKGN